jgi:hypothetical protein
MDPDTTSLITKTDGNQHLDRIEGVGEHQPMWESFDCPSCGSAPCWPHPQALVCSCCADEWPCATVTAVIGEIKKLAAVFQARNRSRRSATMPLDVLAQNAELAWAMGQLVERAHDLGGRR